LHTITLILGDGVGPEVVDAARRCIEATGVQIRWEEAEVGANAMAKYGTLLPEPVLASIRQNRVALKGPITTPVGEGFPSVNVAMRKKLDLYACFRPYKSYPGVRSRYSDIDLIVIRENTEGLYVGVEFEAGSKGVKVLAQATEGRISQDSAVSLRPISRGASQRIIRFAFEYALKNGRRKITAVHKANIMKCTDGLFLNTARYIARDYEGRVGFEDRLVDNMCMQLVQRPQEYDVLVLPNLYGDILSDLCAGLIGGLGVAPGANIGDEIAVFEATHGSAPKYKGLNRVNPVGMILSGVMMLRRIGEFEAANRLENATASVIKEGKYVTYDLKDKRDDPTAVGTSRMADAIVEAVRTRGRSRHFLH
jgi:isocitrate dehydrogenase (NAD+)